ncbi:phosphoglycerate dehydrogenase [Lactobacillaceae bacterium L1_55_11]|nr:phosphoglycerate dehydrogenase [Lactobacillaceae bacterium L1_55_11]
MQKVLVYDGTAQVAIDYLKQNGFEVIINHESSDQDFLDHADVDGMILMMYPMTAELMKQMPNLKVIARHGVGYDNVDINAAKADGIVVTNTPGANANAVAETAVAYALMAGRNFGAANRGIDDPAEKQYARTHVGTELSHKTVGILGFGHIGKRVNELLSGFGINSLVYARHDYDVPNGRMADLDEIFEKSDYVISTLPGVPATHHLVDAAAFKKMKSTAVLVNVGRGSVVDEAALVAALKDGEIASAGLDVVEQEPISPENPLLALPNTFVTPHVASASHEALESVGMAAAKQVVDVLQGKPAEFQVNR